MSDLLAFIVSGIATGAVYGLAGTGLVLTYKTSGIFNFGYGAFATVAAYVFYALHVVHGLNWELSAAISVLGVGFVLGMLMQPLAARLAGQPTTYKVAGTIGIVLLVQALATIKYGTRPLRIPQFLPGATKTIRVAGVYLTYAQLTVAAIALLVVLGLFALFRWTSLGTTMRAVVDDPDLVAMQRISPTRIRSISWIAGSMMAALSGVLLAPQIGLDALTLTLLVVQASGAAAFGYFSNLPLTFVGGIVIGVIGSVSTKYVLNVPWLAGLPQSLPFIVLFVVLLALPRRKLAPTSLVRNRAPVLWRPAAPFQIGTGAIVLAALILVPLVVGARLPLYTIGLTYGIMLLSLGLLVRLSGQVSLCHTTFASISAVAFAQFMQHDMPWLVALVLAALVVVPIGALVAIPAIRLSGLFLALATLGFGILVVQLLYGESWMFTTLAQGRAMPRPDFAGSPRALYWVILAFLVVVSVIVVVAGRSRIGRLLRAIAESPTAVQTMGLSINTAKVIVFCISAFMAGIAGILYGVTVSTAASSDSYYGTFNSLVLLCMLVVAPFGAPWYAIFVGLTTVIPGYFSGPDANYWFNAAFGFFVIVVAVQRARVSGVPAGMRKAMDRLARRRRPSAPAPSGVLAEVRAIRADGPALEVRDLTVRFGGLRALNGVSFAAKPGRITGLIGPNGAGKTTSFNVCSGLQRQFSGRVLLHQHDVSKTNAGTRARHGLGRTFQRIELCDTLTVAENVRLGREAGLAGSRFWAHLVGTRTERNLIDSAATTAMRLCGITDLADQQAGALSTGQRRLVELARCLAGPFDTLLLDEPASGLDREETVQFARVLKRVVDERGVAILLVEHDVAFVMDVCSYIYVLDFGELIFEGTSADVAASPIVRNAYLGSPLVTESAMDGAS